MIKIIDSIMIDAPIEVCFDAARDITIHTKTVWKHTKEKAVRGVTSGPIGLNQTVTFEATHLGLRQTLTSKIVEYQRPYLFVDEMQQGAFKSLRHVHSFEEVDGKTKMTDVLVFEAPYGLLGKMVERLLLARYMKEFIHDRNKEIKKMIEQPQYV